jgi:uncharacterized protein (DUF1501 family)
MAYVDRKLSRRTFLSHAASMGAAAGTPFAMNMALVGAAAAQSATDYKALVCVFFNGGNDQSNMVVPISTAEYAAYTAARPALALTVDKLKALTMPAGWTGPALAVPGQLNNLKQLCNTGQAAVIANVGTLAFPLTKSQWNSGAVATPQQLFSHADQQTQWQTGLPDKASDTGWAGRMGDLIQSTFNPGSAVSMNISVSGNAILLAGNTSIQYQVSTGGPVKVWGLGGLYGSSTGGNSLRTLMTEARSQMIENEYNVIAKRSIDVEASVTAATNAVALTTVFPAGNGLGDQLKMVAKLIGSAQTLGQKRQVFFVSIGGFDFHDNLVRDQGLRLQQVNDAMVAFYNATVELGLANNVTTFTASDFGRGLQSNGRGSDHGWGAHHFVMGGSVRGQNVYGKWPTVALGGPEDAGQGRLIPTTSVDQYAATLCKWFGVSNTDMATILPNLGRFSTPNLGFLG